LSSENGAEELSREKGAEVLNNDIQLIQENWGVGFDTQNFGQLLKDALYDEKDEGNSLIKTVWDQIATESHRRSRYDTVGALKKRVFEEMDKYIVKAKNGVVDTKYHILQALGSNDIWDAQNLGGFEFPVNSVYEPLRKNKLGENGEVPVLVETFVKNSIPENGILFLCESALLFNDGISKGKTFTTTDNEINHLRVCKDKEKYEKVYSASWKNNEIKIQEVTKSMVLGDDKIKAKDYCVFKVIKDTVETLVVVVHVNDKAAKKKRVVSWNNFLEKCIYNNISYVVGDTNVTELKTGATTSNYEPFETGNDGKYVINRSITKFNIKKSRTPGNMWENNQSYKFQPTIEPDGMVILKLKKKKLNGGFIGGRKHRHKRTKKRRKSSKRKRKRKRERKRRKGAKKGTRKGARKGARKGTRKGIRKSREA